jgi:hypothetical protein
LFEKTGLDDKDWKFSEWGEPSRLSPVSKFPKFRPELSTPGRRPPDPRHAVERLPLASRLTVGWGEDGCGGDRAVLVSPVEQTRKPKIGDRCLIAGAAQAQGHTHPVRISIKQHFLSYQTGRGGRCLQQ